MPAQLSPCPQCHRHIRIDEQSCPFCAVSVEVVGSTAASVDFLREQATAIFVGVTLAIAGCDTRTEQLSKPVPVDVNPREDNAPKPQTTPAEPSTGGTISPPPQTPPPHLSPTPIYGAPPKPRPATKYGAPPKPPTPPKPVKP